MKKGCDERLNQDPSLPLISVIIPTHNSRKNLKECLRSIGKTKYPKYEVLVVDAACTDGTYDMLRRDFPDVRVFREGDIGWGESLNHGIIRARGEYIICISDDYTVHPNWLSELVKVASSSKKIGVVGSKVYLYGTEDRIVSAGGIISLTKSGYTFGCMSNDCEKYDSIREIDFSVVPMVRREVFLRVGLFDPDYFCSFDDTDFGFRVKKAGYKIVYVPTAILWHKIGGTTPSGSLKAFYRYHRNRIRFITKNFSAHALLIALPFNVLLLITSIPRLILYNRFEHFKALLHALIWNLKHMRETIQARIDPLHQSFKRLPPRQLTRFLDGN